MTVQFALLHWYNLASFNCIDPLFTAITKILYLKLCSAFCNCSKSLFLRHTHTGKQYLLSMSALDCFRVRLSSREINNVLVLANEYSWLFLLMWLAFISKSALEQITKSLSGQANKTANKSAWKWEMTWSNLVLSDPYRIPEKELSFQGEKNPTQQKDHLLLQGENTY